MSWRDQFAKPTGAMGWLAGQAMAMKNGDRSMWVFSLLDLKPTHRVLEIGFGPGADIARASSSAAFVAGVDHSDVMLRQASKRNAAAIKEGRVELQLGTAAKLPYPDAHFDKVFAINSAQFWKDQAKTMFEVARVLKPGGWALLAVQPRSKNATEETTKQAGIGLSKSLTAAGFEEVHMEMHDTRPVPTVCVLGRK
ncbi:MAG TPA: methyltransferase domain-containing protein [Bryobacteraceae bacterium]|nr:methyltransferase domain-containing protein [Bryobacteraceae bacterium]